MKTNKGEILNAALTVFSQKGYEGALLRDISATLGITKPALYKHFESKEALWNAMIDYVVSRKQEGVKSLITENCIAWKDAEVITICAIK